MWGGSRKGEDMIGVELGTGENNGNAHLFIGMGIAVDSASACQNTRTYRERGKENIRELTLGPSSGITGRAARAEAWERTP
jgi:hypothetical protein